MIDLGIGRIQDFQKTLPGIQSAGGVQGDRSRGQPKDKAVPAGEETERTGKEQDDEFTSLPVDPEKLEREVAQLNELLGGNTSLQFRISQETKNIRIEIVDTRSGEVIKTVPPSETQNLASRLRGGNLLIDNVS